MDVCTEWSFALRLYMHPSHLEGQVGCKSNFLWGRGWVSVWVRCDCTHTRSSYMYLDCKSCCLALRVGSARSWHCSWSYHSSDSIGLLWVTWLSVYASWSIHTISWSLSFLFATLVDTPRLEIVMLGCVVASVLCIVFRDIRFFLVLW